MRSTLFKSLCGIALLICGAANTQAEKIQPLVGRYHKYIAHGGETLPQIARRYNLTLEWLARLNGLPGNKRLKAGTRLILPTLHILPRNPANGIVLNIPERRVYLFKNGGIVAHYPVAVGKASWKTVTGTYRLSHKVINPDWQPTKDMVKREKINDDPVPPGPENPIGDRWMGWSKPGFGFHSTRVPNSIGEAVSHGCVRLYPDAAHKMYDQIKEGMTIYSVYEPIRIGERAGKYYLAVFPDIYHKGLVTEAHACKLLQNVGLWSRVQPGKLRALLKRQDGHPHPLILNATTASTPHPAARPLPKPPRHPAGKAAKATGIPFQSK